MQYFALACDYDGTLAVEGKVLPEHLDVLRKLRASGRKLVLVTGRLLSELLEVFPDLDVFDRVVVENGAVLYNPQTREQRLLAEPASEVLVSALKQRGINSPSVGLSIIATWEPNEITVLEAIRELGLELEVIFNKGAVMILPTGTNKATGLQVALAELSLSEHNTMAIGDAENDHSLFSSCACFVAVANAIPSIKERADFVTKSSYGYGVSELVSMLLENDCRLIDIPAEHPVVLGININGEPVKLDVHRGSILICGPSGSGKTSAAMAIVEQLVEKKYQFCLIDPERDFDHFEGAVVLGNSERAPSVDEVVQLIQEPDKNAVVSLLGLPITERPAFFAALLPHLQELRTLTGRPHWIVVDEAHYLMPAAWGETYNSSIGMDGMLLITVHPDHLANGVLNAMETVISVGSDKKETLTMFCRSIKQQPPDFKEHHTGVRENVVWFRSKCCTPVYVRPWRTKRDHHRHRRKYAEGNLGAYHSFYFTGKDRRLNLCANNLVMFLHLANGIDDETWLYHLMRHDYSRWFKHSIKDDNLAFETEHVENNRNLSPIDSRNRIKLLIEARYSPPV